MFSALVSFLEKHLGPADSRAPALVPHDQLRIAAAALMVEMSRSDFDEAEVELGLAKDLLAERYSLGPADAAALVQAAQKESDHSASLFRFTHLVNQHLDPAEKQQLMAMLWDVAYADGRLDKHEDALMHKLADLLYVPLADLIREKEAAKQRQKARER
ncbi:MAG TPA: TerB family tellurite resistance protein [Gammaproteobacteria bacterium]|nr:TerB family tellurite resistance protein [Gammaproteobacteria bacterium]